MRVAPNWFKKELKYLDPTYRIFYDRYLNVFEIRQRVRRAVGKFFIDDEVSLAIFDDLDRRAMTTLKERKWIGRNSTPAQRRAQMKHQAAEAKAKKKALAQEMMVEGFWKAYQSERRTFFT